MALCKETDSGCLSWGLLLLLWVALGSKVCHGGTATQAPHLAADETATYNLDEIYAHIADYCWSNFSEMMKNVTGVQLCEWSIISRPYSILRYCLENWADKIKYGYPNSVAEKYIFQSHHTYFFNCTLERPMYFDPPEDVLLAMIITPICLIPFLVALVVWRSKDGKMQS
ncbi:receptor activity-modifying protein 2 [Alligator sinensis]|uniref:receptor activity-modifying protein 2 n=1 Tax=Alligator sinensis TaxID=38654 RepID=A0A1U7RBZ3_ALLSI|nr:receptor activity-modifying protein 2 [Alligator sinensis]XP_025056500.1 receptor activity-modifying protein 2 [Alligator sinensis]